MNKNNKLSLSDTLNEMAPGANGASMLPDGKGEVLPTAVDFSLTNRSRSQVPTISAAMASSTPVSVSAPVVDTEEEEVDEESGESEQEEMAEAFRIKFRESIASLLGENNASPELVSQLEAVFEAAVQDRVERNVATILEDVDANVKNYLSEVTNGLVEKVDDYLEYVVEEWMNDNAIAVEQGIKTQIAENFITGLKNLFENHYIDVPSEKYNVLDELYAQNKELEEQLNGAINNNMQLRKEISLTECAGIFVAETKDLADTQIAKLQSLMENVSFESPEEYRNKLVTIKEN